MAVLRQSLIATSSSSSLPMLTSSYSHSNFINKLFLFICLIPFFLALFSFFLQWRTRPANDPIDPWSIEPGNLGFVNPTQVKTSSSDGCTTNNVLGQSSFPVFPYLGDLTFNYNDSDLSPKVRGATYYMYTSSRERHICITTTTSAGLEQILPWIFYHKVVGISNFVIFVEGNAATPIVSKVLESIPRVQVVHRTRELEEEQAKSRIWNETWLSSFFYKPCNYELFVKQNFNMETAIIMARNAGMEWIFHLDTDELLHPAGTKGYSVKDLLTEVPQDVDTVVFANHESAVEREDIREPFSEVSLFKKNTDHLSRETYIGKYNKVRLGNPHYFLTYGNGKAAARIQPHLRPNGAHRWQNYMKQIREMKLEEAAVLHYSYTRFSDLSSRRNRCHCKPTKDDLRRCFMLEFDRNAFVIASTATQDEMLQWYREHVVWSNETIKLELLKSGVFTRIHTPMAIIEGLRESGIFASLITSVVQDISPDFTEISPQLPPRKLNIDSEIPTGKVPIIGVHDYTSQAMPPLSSPNRDGFPS